MNLLLLVKGVVAVALFPLVLPTVATPAPQIFVWIVLLGLFPDGARWEYALGLFLLVFTGSLLLVRLWLTLTEAVWPPFGRP